jgi:hypothetical protein
MTEFEQETNSSPWKKVYPTFKVLDNWFWGIKKPYGKKVYNQIRLVSIDNITCLEVKTQLEVITFLCDIKNYKHIRSHTWTSDKYKNNNTYYIITRIKKNNKKLYFHRLICPEYKLIDHINRLGTDNREINLRETTHSQNMLNCKLMKNNSSGFNGIHYNRFGKKQKRYSFQWCENKKQKSKYFKTKQEAVEFKLAHNKITKNRNGYLI